MNFEDDVCNYSFSYSSSEYPNTGGSYPVRTSASKDVTISDQSAWPVVLREFATFLSGIYGYDITQKVFLKEPNYGGNGVDYEEPVYYRLSDHE